MNGNERSEYAKDYLKIALLLFYNKKPSKPEVAIKGMMSH